MENKIIDTRSLTCNSFETKEIKPYERNPRKHDEIQIARLVESIKQYGFNNPILVDEGNVILAGHGRFLAAKKLKLNTVPVIKITHLSAEQKDQFRLIDNKLALDSDWDTDTMEDLFKQLEDQKFDLEYWGCKDLIKKKEKKAKKVAEDPNTDSLDKVMISCPNCQHEFEN